MASLSEQIRTEIPIRSGRIRIAGFGLLGLAVLACLLGLSAFPDPATAPNGWLPYLASTVLFIAASYLLFPRPVNAPLVDRPTPVILAILGLILAGAAAARVFQLDVLPFGTWNDEAYVGWTAEKILDDPTYRPIYVTEWDHPLHFYAVVALAFKAFGENTLSIRLVTTAFGMLTVAAAFLAGREAFGSRFGLLMAFFLALSRWHLTFSRFGVYTITLPFFELLTAWLLLRARRTGHLIDFAWAGLALGFGFNFYIGFRLFVVAVGVYWLYWLAIDLWRSFRRAGPAPDLSRPRLLGGFLAFGLAAWFATAPIVQFALLNPDQYWSRSNAVSIFSHRDQADLAGALYANTAKHLLMFNYIGDSNGRHNLPAEPMLDPVTGVFFVLGAILALTRLRNPTHGLFLSIFVFNLLGGILTLDFEAPQSNRAFGAIAAVIFFAALAVEALWRTLDQVRLQPSNRLITAGLLACGLGGFVLYYNLSTFFVNQAHNDRSWLEYNGVQSLTAKRMLEADPENTTLYASVFLNNHEAIRFLAPQITDSRVIIPPVGLPFREPGDKPVEVFVDDSDTWIIDEIKGFYPNATFRTDTTPSGKPILFSALVPAADIQSVQGVTVSFWFGSATEGQPALTRDEKQLLADWTAQTPLAPPFVAQWETTLYAPRFGQYEFTLNSPSSSTLWLDGQTLLTGSSAAGATVTLAQGDHALRLIASGGAGAVRLLWRKPDDNGTLAGDLAPIPDSSLYLPAKVPVQGLLGAYYDGSDWKSPPAFTRIDPFLDTYFHIIPLGRPYTVDWSGTITLPAGGNWAFGLRINGQAEVFIDNQSVLNATGPTDYIEGGTNLPAGRHGFHIRYLDYLGGSFIHLYWTAPGGPREIVPGSALSPIP